MTHSVLGDCWLATGIGGFGLGPGEHRPPKSCPGPQFLIGFVVISLSRCFLPNDEGPGPPNIFPRTATGNRKASGLQKVILQQTLGN